MSLSVGFDTARTGLGATAERTALVSRNIALANDPYAARRIGEAVSAATGGIARVVVRRASDDALAAKIHTDMATKSEADTRLAALDRLAAAADGTGGSTSPASAISGLQAALRQYETQPADMQLAQSVLTAAKSTASSLNEATAAVRTVRQDLDADIEAGVSQINTDLSQLAELNSTIVDGTRSGRDVSDQLDSRDKVLASLAEKLGIRVVHRADNDLAVYTQAGVTLFDRLPRTVQFKATPTLSDGQPGNAILIDGVPVTGTAAVMPLSSGSLVASVNARDDTAIAFQRQLDEVARSLITAFAEHDMSASGGLDRAGLFIAGSPNVPGAGQVVDGLAGLIRVNSTVDPEAGGLLTRLRDGGISDTSSSAYVSNTSGSAGFSGRIDEMLAALETPLTIDPATQMQGKATASGLASSSIAWVQQARKSASDEGDARGAALDRSTAALSKVAGVSVDQEMASLLELERSYQASSKLISAIDSMFGSLLDAVR